jgi:membrane protease YdiL (CAAX protease family)
MALVKRFPLWSYFGAAYGISVLALIVIGLPSLRSSSHHTSVTPLIMFPVMMVTIAVAGLVFTRVVGGRTALRALIRGGLGRQGASPGYYAVVLIPPMSILTVLLVLRTLASPAFEPNLFPIGIMFGLIAGFFEEFGWSGFVYPRMRANVGPLRAAVALGLLWALWHVPVVDSLGVATPHGAALPAFFGAFAMVLVSLRILISWVYARTGSLRLAQLTHASSTGFLVMLGATNVTAIQEAAWYAAYGTVLGLVTLVIVIAFPIGASAARAIKTEHGAAEVVRAAEVAR